MNAKDYFGLGEPSTDEEMRLHALIEEIWHKWQSDRRILVAKVKDLQGEQPTASQTNQTKEV